MKDAAFSFWLSNFGIGSVQLCPMAKGVKMMSSAKYYVWLIPVIVVTIVTATLGQQQPGAPTVSATHDITSVFNGLKRVVGPNEKGEFETTEQFNGRMRPTATTQITPLLRFGDPLMLPAPPGWTRYDADKGSLWVRFPTATLREFPLIEASKSTRVKRDYVGQNAFGVKVPVREIEVETFKIALTNPDEFPESLSAALTTTPSLAARLKGGLRLLVIGNPVAPYWSEAVSHSSATINNPEERTEIEHYVYLRVSSVWLYDVASKEVLHRVDRSRYARIAVGPHEGLYFAAEAIDQADLTGLTLLSHPSHGVVGEIASIRKQISSHEVFLKDGKRLSFFTAPLMRRDHNYCVALPPDR